MPGRLSWGSTDLHHRRIAALSPAAVSWNVTPDRRGMVSACCSRRAGKYIELIAGFLRTGGAKNTPVGAARSDADRSARTVGAGSFANECDGGVATGGNPGKLGRLEEKALELAS